MAIKFWYVEGACSLAVRICLNEIGASFESVRMEMGKEGTQSEEFGQINPKQSVPVLSIDDDVITELPAILTAVSLLSPQHQLMGSSNLEVARSYEWLNWLSGTLQGRGFASLWKPARFSDEPDTFASISLKGRQTIAEVYAEIESRLYGAHSVGTQFSSVDALLLVYYMWGNMIGIEMTQYANYSRFINILLSRESVVEAFEAEHVSINGPENLPNLSN